MRFPDWLYQLLTGDAGTQQLGVIWRDGENSVATGAGASVVSATIYTVPADKCLILTNATVRAFPGATQVSYRRRLFSDPPDGTKRYNILDGETNSVANTAIAENWAGEVVIPGGWKVKVEGDFNDGTNVNQVEAEIHGYLIPRGTFIFG